MKKFLVLILLLDWAAAAYAQDSRLANPAEAFGHRESVSDIALSPDGASVAYLAPGQGRQTRLYVFNLETRQENIALASAGDPWELTDCDFVSAQRLVCSVYALIDDAGVTLPFQRFIAVNSDGSNQVSLGQVHSFYQVGHNQADGQIIDWLPDEDGVVLMSRVYVPEGRAGTHLNRTEDGLGVDRVDTRTGNVDHVERARRAIDFYMTDGRGNVRILGTVDQRGATGMTGRTIRYSYRLPGEGEWRPLATYDMMSRGGFYPVAIDPDENAVYGFEHSEGRSALFRISLDENLTRERVFAHESVDVDDLVRLGPSGPIIGVSFAEDTRFVEYFDPEYRSLAGALSQALPQLPLIRFIDASRDRQTLLIWAGSDDDPGRYYVFDRGSNRLNEVLLSRPRLENFTLSHVRPVRYPAPDGTQIPGYLTLPPSGSGRNLPAIVMPHGGPSARDEWGFDWLAQFFANRGYAVLQPNFRGSAGYGDDWFVVNGFQNWQTAISDIDAGGRWLISEGVADPERIAIVGWSYGGYAALQSAVFEPGLFKAVVAIAPVTDLSLLREQSRVYTSGANVAEYLGTGPHIREGSPAEHADRITVPVLLFHGDEDFNVDIRHSRLMQSRLQSAGRDSELVVFEHLAHSLDDSQARTTLLARSDAFLREALRIGGAPPSSVDH